MTTTDPRPIRLGDLVEELGAWTATEVIARSMEELAIAQALTMIHGPDRAAAMYIERGGHMRFDADGEPVWLWTGEVPPSPFS